MEQHAAEIAQMMQLSLASQMAYLSLQTASFKMLKCVFFCLLQLARSRKTETSMVLRFVDYLSCLLALFINIINIVSI